MRFSIVTAFPSFFNDFLSTSMVGRAVKSGLLSINRVDLHAFGKGGYRQIDDYAFGSGGMVLMAQPLEEAMAVAREGRKKSFVVYPSPQGTLLTQEVVESLFHQEHVTIVCGHYEGLDERFVEREVDLEVRIGDCVLTGGEIPAMAIIDAVSRLVPGVVGRGEAVVEDSFFRGMLDHPHYTRPACWNDEEVPEALTSGNAAEIKEWRRKQAVNRTLSRRPDLVSRASLSGYLRGGVYFLLESRLGAEGLERRALDWEELCGAYRAERLLLVVQDPAEREKFRQVFENVDCKASKKYKLFPSWDRALDWVGEKEKKNGRPLRVAVPDVAESGARHWLDLKCFILEQGVPVVFCFSEGAGFSSCDISMIPLQEGDLPLGGKLAAVCDRFLGSR